MVLGLALTGLVVTLLLVSSGLTIVVPARGMAIFPLPMALLLFGWLRFRLAVNQRQRQWRDFFGHLLMFLTICLLGVLASYGVAARTTGFADPVLNRIDMALHFHWLAWYREVSAVPALQNLGIAAYACIYLSPVIILAQHARTQRIADARQFLLTFWFGAVLTILLFPLFPAEGPLAFLWHGRIPYMPTSALYQEQLIPALRAHRVHQIDLGALRGLVCAPSFHTVSAVIYMFAAWPLRQLRWPLLALNLAMLAATPIEGTHYLADMIAGSLVALVAILVVTVGLRTWSRQAGGG
ncbi:MAG: phosphatase PAP2 family protein [Sphingomonadales bacterium]|nr:phosphatase PAP2 family protein [Sphingomonadales bacterium]